MTCSVWVAACNASPPAQPALPSTPLAQLEARFADAHLQEGRAVYLRQCVSCHQPDGRGTGAAIPPLAGHVPKLAAPPLGKTYLARLGLYGLRGQIAVNGRCYNNLMPAHGPILSDVQVAGALNFAMTQWGNDAAMTADMLLRPQDVAEQRQTGRTAADNAALRRQLGLADDACGAQRRD